MKRKEVAANEYKSSQLEMDRTNETSTVETIKILEKNITVIRHLTSYVYYTNYYWFYS